MKLALRALAFRQSGPAKKSPVTVQTSWNVYLSFFKITTNIHFIFFIKSVLFTNHAKKNHGACQVFYFEQQKGIEGLPQAKYYSSLLSAFEVEHVRKKKKFLIKISHLRPVFQHLPWVITGVLWNKMFSSASERLSLKHLTIFSR